MNYYICKVTYDDGISQSGKVKSEKLDYLVEDLTVEAAEKKMQLFLKDSARDYEITSVTKSKIAEIVK